MFCDHGYDWRREKSQMCAQKVEKPKLPADDRKTRIYRKNAKSAKIRLGMIAFCVTQIAFPKIQA